jgi:hypothetical protein
MATINYISGNINVSMFPTNANPIWFCDKNTGGINIATNGAAMTANTIQLGNAATTTNVSGILKTNTIISNTPTTLNIGDQTCGLMIGDKNVSGINIGTNGDAFADNTLKLGNLNTLITNFGRTVIRANDPGYICNSSAPFGGLGDFQFKAPFRIEDRGYSTNGIAMKMGIFRDTGAAYIQVENTNTASRSLCLQSYSGHVGIGTVSPSCPLEIGTTLALTTAAGKYWSYNVTVLTNWGGGVNSLGTSVKALGSFLTSDAFVSASDRRIKTNIVDIQDDAALQLFRRLQPKTYEYVDKVRKGPDPVYGFIAQEVREVLPLAAKVTTDTAPNLYTMCEVSGDVLTLDTTLLEYDASGELFPRLKLIKEDNSECFVRILSVEGNTVQIDTILTEDKVFVYGQEVNNFHTLNKDAIWTVAAAALQEVDRQVQRLDEQLQSEKEKTKTLEQNYEQLLQRILALESKGSA